MSTQAGRQLTLVQLPVGQLSTNCYVIGERKSRQAIIVDPGDDAQYIENNLRDLNLLPTQVVATHGHFDHILAAWEICSMYNIPFLINKEDEFLVQRMQKTAHHFLHIDVPESAPSISSFLTSEDTLYIGGTKLKIIECPGHTPGSICVYADEDEFMLTGDTIFAEGGVGRTDFSYSSASDLEKSISCLFTYPEKTILYPGHGKETTIAHEKMVHGVQ